MQPLAHDTNERVNYYYVMFIVALLGILLHFPKRDHLTAATYRQQNRIEQNWGI